MSRSLASTMCLAFVALACRARGPQLTAPAPSGPSEREVLLARISALDEVTPCLVDASASSVHIVDAELAGDAATMTFSCDNGAAAGKVTFFRIAGAWTISTKEISVRPPGARALAR